MDRPLGTTALARELRMSVSAVRSWLSACRAVVRAAEREGHHGALGYPRTAQDLQMLRLAAKAFEDNDGRLDRRQALRRAAVFLGRLPPEEPSVASGVVARDGARDSPT